MVPQVPLRPRNKVKFRSAAHRSSFSGGGGGSGKPVERKPIQRSTSSGCKAVRPQRSFSANSNEESRRKLMNQLSFEMNTQEIRSKERRERTLQKYLPVNYQEVLTRLEHKKSEQKKHEAVAKASSRPLKTTNLPIDRLSRPRTGVSPTRHMHHCSASHSSEGNKKLSSVDVGGGNSKKPVKKRKRKAHKIRKRKLSEISVESGQQQLQNAENIRPEKDIEISQKLAEENVSAQKDESFNELQVNALESGPYESEDEKTKRIRKIIEQMSAFYLKSTVDEEKPAVAEVPAVSERTIARRAEAILSMCTSSSTQTTEVTEFENFLASQFRSVLMPMFLYVRK